MVAREWDERRARRVLKVDPFYVGRLWRDWGFARAVCARLATRARSTSCSRTSGCACCDVYRAGDGVHRQWLENRARGERRARAARDAPQPVPSLRARRGAAAFREPAAPRGDLQLAHGARRDPASLRHAEGEAARRLQRRGPRRLRAGAAPGASRARARGAGHSGRRDGVPARRIGLRAQGRRPRCSPRSRGSTTGTRGSSSSARTAPSRRMRAAAARPGVGNRVHFAGGQADVRPWYGAADCFVLATLYDPFPNAALEALASGLPIVVSRQSRRRRAGARRRSTATSSTPSTSTRSPRAMADDREARADRDERGRARLGARPRPRRDGRAAGRALPRRCSRGA